ncbi:molybdopterin-dependent oxidoreductase [Pedobacter panaciterrae]
MGFRNPQQLNGVIGSGVKLADIFLPVKINGDMALLKAIELLLIDFEKKSPGVVFDLNFIAEKTVGFDAFIKQFEDYNLEDLAKESGVSLATIYDAAQMLAFKKRIIICWGMGITQQPNGVDMIKEMLNILLLKGSIGKPGAGVCPVRGHSNVQGNRTMMIDEKPTDAQLDRLQDFYGFNPLVNMAMMLFGQSKQCRRASSKFYSVWVETFYPQHRIPPTRQMQFGNLI